MISFSDRQVDSVTLYEENFTHLKNLFFGGGLSNFLYFQLIDSSCMSISLVLYGLFNFPGKFDPDEPFLDSK